MSARPGRVLRDHQRVMSQPFVPRTIEEEERAGYEVGQSFRARLSAEARGIMAEGLAADLKGNGVDAARARGLLRGLSGDA